MTFVTIEGLYENGIVALAERPEGIERARVVVTFLPAEPEMTEQTGDEAQRRREAGERLLAGMRQGINFGGEKFDREELYAERLDELDQRRR